MMKFQQLRLWVGLSFVPVLLSWHLPNHSQPWPAFYNEAMMTVALLPLGGWLLLRSSASVFVPTSGLLILLFSLVPMLQWASGQLRFVGDALLASLYLIGLTICIVLGARWRELNAREAATMIFSAFASAALLSTSLALMQWLQIDSLGTFLVDMPAGGRPYANIAQPNHLASLIFLGLVSIWALFLRSQVCGQLAWSAAAFLLFGIAMTQSRTAWLEIVLIAAAAGFWRDRLSSRRYLWGLISLGALFVLLVAFWPLLNQGLLIEAGRSLDEQTQAGTRPAHWRILSTSILDQPWLGFGWTQVVLAHQAFAPLQPPVREIVTYAHNIWLDLLVWNGLPLGMLASAAIVGWFWRQAQRVRSSDETLLLVLLIGLLVHAQFEFPHAYAYFLFPAGLIAGLLTAGQRFLAIPRLLALCVGAVVALVPFVFVYEYARAEATWQLVRMASARIKIIAESDVRRLVWLDQLQALIDQSGNDPTAPMTKTEQAVFRTAVERFPGSGNLYRLAIMDAHNLSPAQAQRTLALLCAVYPASTCSEAIGAWKLQGAVSPAMTVVKLPAGLSLPILP